MGEADAGQVGEKEEGDGRDAGNGEVVETGEFDVGPGYAVD